MWMVWRTVTATIHFHLHWMQHLRHSLRASGVEIFTRDSSSGDQDNRMRSHSDELPPSSCGKYRSAQGRAVCKSWATSLQKWANLRASEKSFKINLHVSFWTAECWFQLQLILHTETFLAVPYSPVYTMSLPHSLFCVKIKGFHPQFSVEIFLHIWPPPCELQKVRVLCNRSAILIGRCPCMIPLEFSVTPY